MTPRRLGCVSAVAVAAGLIGVLVVATYVPPPHPIHTAGARAIDAREGGSILPYRGRVPAATTSLEALRCAVWTEQTTQPCPDPVALSQRLLPWLRQTPATLYWPLPSEGGYSSVSGPGGFNVEYEAGLQRLVVHDYISQPLFVLRHYDSEPGAALAPGIAVLVVSTLGMSSGVVTLGRDFWIERVNGDQANGEDGLGTVEIP